MKYKEIAEKYNIKSVSTVKSWATRYWKVATTNKEVATERKSCNHKKVIKKKLLDSVNNNNDLTEKQRLFCVFYATSNNATQSYLKAYQCNKTTAMVEGCNHLKNIKIKAEIQRLKEILRATLNIDVSDMIQYCLKVVGADIGEYVTFGRRKVPVMGAFGPIIDKKTKKPIMHEINYIDANESCKLDTSLLQEIKQGRDGISIKMADIYNAALSNDSQKAINLSMLEDADDITKGRAFIRVNGDIDKAIKAFPVSPIQSWTFNLITYLDSEKENRTGITKYNQGLDSNTLNKTATGINIITQQANQRLELIARIFAETGLYDMFRYLIKMNQLFINEPTVIRLTSGPITIDPTDLDGEFDLVVNAGMGAGAKQTNLQNLQMLQRSRL
nr:terminase small subunit [Pectinatus frisingensis]